MVFISAFVALGISLGFGFVSARGGPRGSDVLDAFQGVDQKDVPEDIQEKIFEGIIPEERPQAGDRFAIWGGECAGV